MVFKVRKLPIVMEAVKFTGSQENLDILMKWSNYQVAREEDGKLKVECLEATAHIFPGDYVVKGIKGEVWPVRYDIFEETYEILSADILSQKLVK